MTINREWHEANRLPRNATTPLRIDWHLAHQKACGCRPIPARLQAEIGKRADGGQANKGDSPGLVDGQGVQQLHRLSK